jgi:hypothetical protein
MPHSNQNTDVNIESYCGALKCWFVLDKISFKGSRIDWPVWLLTTTIAHHYMHTLEMKKKGFIKNKVVEAIVTQNVESASFIPLTHVYKSILESDGAWDIQSQHLPNIIYVVKFPFIKISFCTCEWVLQRNTCKHQIVVILACTNIIPEDIIHYCGTWYGSHCERLGFMFVNPQHI